MPTANPYLNFIWWWQANQIVAEFFPFCPIVNTLADYPAEVF